MDGIRRELATMNQHIAGDLGDLKRAVEAVLLVHHEEIKTAAEIRTRLEFAEKDLQGLHESKRQAKSERWVLLVGVALALLGHLLSVFSPFHIGSGKQ